MSKRILLIDSDENFAQELQSSLLAGGFNAVTATDSEEGMTLAREDHPDLLVVCVEAQPTNGYMLCTRLKKDEQLKGIPIILTSANATEESFEKHKKLKTRAEEYLIKPFEPAVLLEMASGLLGVALSPASRPANDGIEDEIVTMEDEPLGLGDLVADEDEPIRLSDSEAAAAREPEAEILDESVEVEIEEEQVEAAMPVLANPDDDLQLFDRAFDAIGKPGEESPAPARAAAARSRPAAPSAAPAPRAVPAPRLAEAAPDAEDELAFAALDALDDSQQAVLEEPAEVPAPPAARAVRAVQPAPKGRGAAASDARRAGGDPDSGAQARKAEKEIERLKEELEERQRELGDLRTQAEELREAAEEHKAASKSAQQRADSLAAAAKKSDRELAQLREQLDAVAGEKELAGEEREELRQKLAAAEAEASRNEERAVKAYQKMKGDERLREKTRKALQVALQLLEEGTTGSSESRETSGPEKQSA